MGLITKIKYSYNDISIVPADISYTNHRKECNPFYEDGMLPLFTAPMTSVVDEKNFEIFEQNKIHAILPRTVDLDKRIEYSINGKWAAFGLNEFEDVFIKNTIDSNKIKILIDVANGHMERILKLVTQFKEKYKDIDNKIMVGNIANPLTYYHYAKVGVDYVRCSVGTGSACLTTSNTSVHYPMASLIDEIKEIKEEVSCHKELYKSIPQIIADGGVRNYSDAIKALALGADYVMIGGVFTKMLESAAPSFVTYCDDTNYSNPQFVSTYITDFTKLEKAKGKQWNVWNADKTKYEFQNVVLHKEMFGMASKQAQELMHGKKIHTSEGLSKIIIVEYTMEQWVNNFIDYLRSAMSYTNSKTLDYFKNNTTTIVISNNTYQSVNK